MKPEDILRNGPASSAELMAALQVSQPTLSRTIKDDAAIVKMGRAKSTRYALRRNIDGVENFPVYQINEQGQAACIAMLHTIWPGDSCAVESLQGEWKIYDGIPWYLSDLRPQGFLGRVWGRKMAARLGLPEDIRLWTEKHILLALSQWGESTIGNFLVGEASYQRLFAIEADSKIDAHRKTEAYQKLAELSLAGEQVGSSAGGEQPKFSCLTSHKSNECAHVLVKFSLGAAANDNARRWADLLQTEALALHTLAEQNIPAASAQVFFGNGGEVFLEIERFDRVGLHGRKGIISLEAVAAEFLGGRAANWIDAAKFLLQQGIIDRRCFDRIGQLYAFGRLIANSDMHPGNLSFINPLHFPLQLSPVYDMLPMAFAPGSSGNMRQSVAKIVLDTQLSKDCWLQAQAWAISFWQRVVTSETISKAFRQLASEMLALVSGLTAEINRLA